MPLPENAVSRSNPRETTDKTLSLYTAWYCPYAQRSWALIEHLGLAYQNIAIDPYIKSPEWMRVSRNLGQVPVVHVTREGSNDLSVPGSVDSMVYLRGLAGQVRDADMRADEAFWLGHIDRLITPNYYRFLNSPTGSTTKQTGYDALIPAIFEIVQEASLGKWFLNGDEPGLVDFSLAPFALRMNLLFPHFKQTSLPTSGKDWVAYHAWCERMIALPAFKRSITNQDTYMEDLIDYYASFIAENERRAAENTKG